MRWFDRTRFDLDLTPSTINLGISINKSLADLFTFSLMNFRNLLKSKIVAVKKIEG